MVWKIDDCEDLPLVPYNCIQEASAHRRIVFRLYLGREFLSSVINFTLHLKVLVSVGQSIKTVHLESVVGILACLKGLEPERSKYHDNNLLLR